MELSSRRDFLLGVGGISLCGALRARSSGELVDYIVSPESIDVFRTGRGRRSKTQEVPSKRPSFLVLDAGRALLFAVNEVAEYQGLPTGSMESYAIQPESGHLKLISRQALSMSATMPRHFAVSPDGRQVVVAVYGGGAYNVLPVSQRGELEPPAQILKETGYSLDPERQSSAHPHSVVFHPSGKFLIGTDLGSDRINVFDFQHGRLSRTGQLATPPGSGPAQVWMNQSGSAVFVRHELRPLFSSYRFHAATGQLIVMNGRRQAGQHS